MNYISNVLSDNMILLLSFLMAPIIILLSFLIIKVIIGLFRKQNYNNKVNIRILFYALIVNSLFFIIFIGIGFLPSSFSILYPLLLGGPPLLLSGFYLYFLSDKHGKENSIYLFISCVIGNQAALMLLIILFFQKNGI